MLYKLESDGFCLETKKNFVKFWIVNSCQCLI